MKHLSVIILFFLVFLFLWRMKPILRKGGSFQDYLSKEACQSVKGLLAIWVICHHLAQITDASSLTSVFITSGFLCVSMFFFYSGYGLQKQNLQNCSYANHFILKRIPQVLIPYLIVTLLYWAVFSISGNGWSPKQVFLGFLNGTPIVSYSWYVIAILCYYLCFGCIIHLFPGQKLPVIVGTLLFSFIWILTCYQIGRSIYWFNAIHILALGVIWASYENQILKFINRCNWLCIVVSALMFTVALMISKQIHMMELAASCLFVIFTLSFLTKVQISNPALLFFGSISYELYLLQGLVIFLLRQQPGLLQNNLLFSVLTIIGTIALSWCAHKLFQVILRKYRHYLNLYLQRKCSLSECI